MQQNVGTVDKIIRVVIGLALMSLLFILTGNLRFLGLIGIIPLVTAFVGFCPLYTLFGLRTCPLSKDK